MKKIAVLTSGGDSPGMNAAIRSVVRSAINNNINVYGIMCGYKGMIENDIVELHHSDVSNIISKGGTMLQSARSLSFKTQEGQTQAIENLKKHGIEGIVVIGGDGSLTGAKALSDQCDIKNIGIPASIDNDLSGTDMSLGVDSALTVIVNSIDMINNTATSHNRTFIVEVMGRQSGYLALASAIATGSDAVIIPEFDPDIDGIVTQFKKRHAERKTRNILILAEGAGEAHTVAKQFEATGLEPRVTVLGHIQRGGTPTSFDRLLGSRMGKAAVDALIANKSGVMVGLQGNDLKLVPYEEVLHKKNKVNKEDIELFDIIA